ncbi:Imm49 family immunity protein [Cytophagaceae bacterium YF14B1]|uniref:Imm49 family immunity protein n=1 Tax=Xanthocytophaga flava TaxID=3048013 RepID=A0AAE3UDQ6_9BACT|nr:Imm49 family immunity protein [Xanthocytophaga flavus]
MNVIWHESASTIPEEKRTSRFSQRVLSELQYIIKLKDNVRAYSIDGVARSYWHNIGYSARYSSSNFVYNYIYYTNQLIRAWFTYTMNDDKPVTVQIADRQIETTGKFSNSGIGVYEVLEGIWTASVIRDKDALAFYAQIPLEFTERAQGMEDILYECMLLFYQVLIRGTDNPNEAAGIHNRLIELLDWDQYRRYIDDKFSEYEFQYMFKYRSWVVRYIFLPVLKIYYAVLAKKQEEYESAVYNALLQWKEYYTLTDTGNEKFDHSTEPDGFISLPILAACAYGYDRGMSLQTVSSEYIPEWLIKGNFTGLELLVKD